MGDLARISCWLPVRLGWLIVVGIFIPVSYCQQDQAPLDTPVLGFIIEGDIHVVDTELKGDVRISGEDVIPPSSQEDWAANGMMPVSKERSRVKRAVTSNLDRIWPNATLPYVVGSKITGRVRRNILKAMHHWEKQTCIHFVNRTTEQDYLLFNPGPCGCCSFVGRKGGPQDVTLSPHCAAYGVVIHELGHVIGFWHEHSRPDRDDFINILYKNIQANRMDNFAMKSVGEINSLGQPYDYYSIMHYRRKTFSRNGEDTMEPKREHMVIGQRITLSPGDIMQTKLLYDCPKPRCYEELYEKEGNFSTPNYPINYFKAHVCTWILHLMPGEEVEVDFLDFDIESSPNCTYDYLEVREGIDETGKLIGRLCGKGQPGVIQSTSSLWMRFVSDPSYTRKGFSAQYTKTGEELLSGWSSGEADELGSASELATYSTRYRPRCSQYFSEAQGQIKSPLIPSSYSGNSVECSWTVDGGANASRIQVTFEEYVRGVPHCSGDIYQQVVHRVRHQSPLVAEDDTTEESVEQEEAVYYDIERYTKVRYNCQFQQLLLHTAALMLQWSSETDQAFLISYIVDYNECGLDTAQCDHDCHNTLESYVCSCRRGYMLHSNGRRCVPKLPEFSDHCGSNLTRSRGKIRASTEPLADCYWHITQPPGTNIQLTFTKFNVQSNTTDNGQCVNYIEILTGDKLKAKESLCGTVMPVPLTIQSNVMAIRMHTDLDNAEAMPYFSARYLAYKQHDASTGNCFHKMKAKGTVTSPNYPHSYPADAMCVWRISASRGDRVRLEFDYLDLELTKLCHFDFVEVRDGKHREAPLIGRYCGDDIIPGSIVSTDRHLRIMFISDGEGSGTGFKIRVRTEPSKREHKRTEENLTEEVVH